MTRPPHQRPGEPGDQSRKGSRARLLAAKIVFLLLFAVVASRLVQIQAVESGRYKDMARRQYENRIDLPAARGNIYDRNRRVLVSSAMDVSFAADPRMLGADITTVARTFSSVFGTPFDRYHQRLKPQSSNFVWLERHVPHALAAKIGLKDVDGIIRMEEQRRVHHFGSAAGQLLGFTDIDCRGISGLELEFDEGLRGLNGYEVKKRDGLGRALPAVEYPRIEPVDGHDIVLTIDLDYQAVAEEALREGVNEYGAESGLVVMLDPNTGELLAVANYPPLDPAEAGNVDQARTRNRVITDMFEPGSVFKVVTAAAALEHGIVTPEQKFFAEHGAYKVALKRGGERTIRDIHEYGMLTFREGMEFSSNIVMAKASDLIGSELLYRMARDFGFGTKTGVELPGEISGELKKPTEWSGTTLNSMAYGYEIGVTPIQLAAAYSAVASGGILYRPTIVKEIVRKDGGVLSMSSPQVIRRVISKETAKTLAGFFGGVVERGTGKASKSEAVVIAGKTGTSRKVIDGHYVPGSYTATFAGFFPLDDPKVVCVVMLDTRSTSYTGGLASAPIFKRIAERVVGLSDRFSDDAVADGRMVEGIRMPDVIHLKTEDATSLLETAGFDVEAAGDGAFVVGQSPSPGTVHPAGGRVGLKTADAGEGDRIPVPNLRSLSIRRAMNRLHMLQLHMAVNGSGVVVGQNPPAGEVVPRGTVVHLRCRMPGTITATMQ
jgi:cell division protein FtsI (penicillin-binding protein 3)